jgi:hypothetical protein
MGLVDKLEHIIHDRGELGAFVHHGWHSLDTTGELPSRPTWEYLTWRRDLDPARFDAHHPRDLDRVLAAAKHWPREPESSTICPPLPCRPPCHAVPEPPAWVPLAIGILFAGGLLWIRSRRIDAN